MDKIERIRMEVEGLRKHYIEREDFDIGWNYAVDKVLSLLDTFEEEPVSEDLSKAAIDAADNDMQGRQIMESSHDDRMLYSRIFRRGFKAGAEWQKETMMKDAVCGYVIEDIEEGNGDFLLSADYIPASMGLKDRQKVKVIILKDE